MTIAAPQLDDRIVAKIKLLTGENVLSCKEMVPIILKGRSLVAKHSLDMNTCFSDRELKAYNLGLLYDIYEDR